MLCYICFVLLLIASHFIYEAKEPPDAAGVEVVEEEPWDDFQRLYAQPKVGSLDERFPCTRDQIDTGEPCILRPPSRALSDRKHDFFSSVVDLLSLSNLIHHIVYLRQMVAKNKTTTNNAAALQLVSKEKSVGLIEIENILLYNLDLLAEENSVELEEATSFHKLAPIIIGDKLQQTDVEHRLFHKISNNEEKFSSTFHAITVNHKLKRVDVIFGGSSTVKSGWKKRIPFKRALDNPVKLMNATVPTIKIRARYYDAVVGGSEKTGKHRYKEILDDVEEIMPDGYQLFVSGYSFAGATATLFGFFAANYEQFTRNGPIVVVSFASPPVGDVSFRKAFKWLEERGKIRHARIHDKRPRVGENDKHVGLGIQLEPFELPKIDYPVVSERWFQKRPGNIFRHILSPRSSYNSTNMLHLLISSEIAFNSTNLEAEYKKIWYQQGQQHTYQYSDLNQSFVDKDPIQLRDILDAQPSLANVMDENGWTILHEIARAPDGFYDTLKFIFEHGIADVNARNGEEKNGDTLLDVARRFQDDQNEHVHQDTVSLFISHGAKSSYDLDFETYRPILFESMASKDHHTIAYILLNRSDLQFPFRRDANGWTILHESVRSNDLEVVRVVLEVGGADVNARVGKDQDGHSVLDVAVGLLPGGDHNSIVKYLISQGAKSSVDLDKAQYTMRDLVVALVEKQDDHFRTILKARPDLVRVKDQNGWMILHEVSRFGNIDLVEFLVEKLGADVNVRVGSDEENALDIANRFLDENHDVVQYLQKQFRSNQI